jgi:hypothetical protein
VPAQTPSRYDGSFQARGSAPILVLGTTGDPDTPYQDAVALSRQLDNASLLTFDAEGRTAFGRSACATDAVVGHLVDLEVPASGTTCTDKVQPPSSCPEGRPARDDAERTAQRRRRAPGAHRDVS